MSAALIVMALDVARRDTPPSITRPLRDAISDPSAGAYSVQEAPQTISTFGSSVKKRRVSKAKTGRAPPRSMSTPQLRGPVMSESDLDKKRNKLGYQRISIACGNYPPPVPCADRLSAAPRDIR